MFSCILYYYNIEVCWKCSQVLKSHNYIAVLEIYTIIFVNAGTQGKASLKTGQGGLSKSYQSHSYYYQKFLSIPKQKDNLDWK